MANYLQEKKKTEEIINSFYTNYGFFAFNKDQLDEGLKKLNCKKSELASIGGGGFMLKTKIPEYMQAWEDFDNVEKQRLLNDDYLFEALVYELSNHEFCCNQDPEPTLSALGVDIEWIDANWKQDVFKRAKREYFANLGDY